MDAAPKVCNARREQDRALRILTVLTMIPALGLLIASGVVSRNAFPALTLIPMGLSCVVGMTALGSKKEDSYIKNALPGADFVAATFLMVMMVLRYVTVDAVQKEKPSRSCTHGLTCIVLRIVAGSQWPATGTSHRATPCSERTASSLRWSTSASTPTSPCALLQSSSNLALAQTATTSHNPLCRAGSATSHCQPALVQRPTSTHHRLRPVALATLAAAKRSTRRLSRTPMAMMRGSPVSSRLLGSTLRVKVVRP
jgi:hypothetical protein